MATQKNNPKGFILMGVIIVIVLIGILAALTIPRFKQAMIKGSWRDGRAGWLAASTTSAGTLMKHMILYELGRGDSR